MATFICNPKVLLGLVKSVGGLAKIGRMFNDRIHLRVRDGVAEIGLINHAAGVLTLTVPGGTGEGEFTAPLREIMLMLGWSRDESVTISQAGDEDVVKVSGPAWSSSIPEVKPDAAAQDRERWLPVEPGTTSPPDLRAAFRSVMFAMSNDVTRHNLCGVNLRFRPGELVLEVCDGHRAARFATECEGTDARSLIVEREAVEIVASLPETPTSWAFDAGSSDLYLISPSWSLVTRLIPEAYPDFDRVFPAAPPISMKAAVGETDALKRIAQLTSPKTRCVHVKVERKRAHISAASCERQVDASFPVDGTAALKLGFNVAYLNQAHDSLKRAGAETIEWRMTDEFSPVIVSSPEVSQITHLIMPMRV